MIFELMIKRFYESLLKIDWKVGPKLFNLITAGTELKISY